MCAGLVPENVLLAIDNMRDGLAFTDEQGLFTFMNRAHLTMFGFSEMDQVLGRPWSILYPPETVAWFTRFVMPHLGGHGAWQGEVVGVDAQGRQVPQEVTLSLLQGAGGGIVCQTRNIQQRKNEQRAFERLKAFLTAAETRAAMAHQVESVCHDVAGFLALADARLQLVAASQECNAQAIGHLAAAEAALGHARDIIRSANIAQSEPHRVQLDVVEMIGELVGLVDDDAGERGRIRLRSELASAISPLDLTALSRAVINMINNGFDAGSSAIEVALTGEEPPFVASGEVYEWRGGAPPAGARFVLTVTDWGSGISPELLGQVLNSYFTTKRGREGAGRGLGLDSVASLINAHGCSLRVASAIGCGAQFSITAPAASVRVKGAAERSARDASARPTLPLVAIVEDDPYWLDLISSVMKSRPLQVETFDRPSQLAEAVRSNRLSPDVVVFDEHFANCDERGSEAARRLMEEVKSAIIVSFSAGGEVIADAFHIVVSKRDGVMRLVDKIERQFSQRSSSP